MRSPSEEAPWIVRRLTGPWHWRHPRLFVGLELLVSVWLVVVGILLMVQGYWEGALCVAAALLGWFLSLFARSAIGPGSRTAP